MKSNHTGGKWEVIKGDCMGYGEGDGEGIVFITSDEADRGDICDLYHKNGQGDTFIKPNALVNAKRIIACVNALDGISNEALDKGAVGEMVELLEYMLGIGEVGIADEFDQGSESVVYKAEAILSKLEDK